MKLIHRLGYYSFGFIVGLLLLFFFLGGKKTSCDYSPNARVLKNIRYKKRSFSDEVQLEMNTNAIDTSYIAELLKSGNVDFGKSDTQKSPCKEYSISGKVYEKLLEIRIQNCDSLAHVQSIKVIN